MKLSSQSKKLLGDILSLPTAPFHEHKVIGYVAKFCLKHGFKLKQDSAGNIFIRYKTGKARQPVVMTAHMDHPGFEVISASGKSAEVGILGGVNQKHFKNAKIIVSTKNGPVKGWVVKKIAKKWMGKPVFKIKMTANISRGDFGYFDLLGAVFKNDMINSKSADNLAGTALLLDLLLTLKQRKAKADVTVILTRAEEVGFVGCIYIANSGLLKEHVPLIVLETSDYKAGGVKINAGPVIRVGDKQAGFLPEMDIWLQRTAEKIAKKTISFKYQRALLAGGRCEASIYLLKKYLVGGLAFPLGNYHNNGDKSYDSEYIGASDYINMLEFCYHLTQSGGVKEAFESRKKELWDNFAKWEKRLG